MDISLDQIYTKKLNNLATQTKLCTQLIQKIDSYLKGNDGFLTTLEGK